MRKSIKLDGAVIFMFLLDNTRITGYDGLLREFIASKDLREMSGISDESEFQRECQKITIPRIKYAMNMLEKNPEEWKLLVTEAETYVLEGEGIKIEGIQKPAEFTRKLFLYRRQASRDKKMVTENVGAEIDEKVADYVSESDNSEVRLHIIKLFKAIEANAEIEQKFYKMPIDIQCSLIRSCPDEMTLIDSVIRYYKDITEFKTYKNSAKKALILKYVEESRIGSYEDLAQRFCMTVSEIYEIIKGDRVLRKRINTLMKRNNFALSEPKHISIQQESKKKVSASNDEMNTVQVEEKPSEVVETVPAEEEKPSEVVETVPAEEKKPSEVVETVRAEEEKPSEVVETVRAEEEKPSEVIETVSAEEENPSEVVEIVTAEEEKLIEVVETITAEEAEAAFPEIIDINQRLIKNRIFCKQRGGLVEWCMATKSVLDPNVIMPDTNILLKPEILSNLKGRFSRSRISTICVIELRKLLKNSETKKAAEDAILNIARNKDNFFIPLGDSVYTGPQHDNDILLVDRAKENDITFVTADAGAAVYARSIGCPFRYLRTKHPDNLVYSLYSGPKKICVLDTGIYCNKLEAYLKANFSGVVITSEYAKALNKRKRNPNEAEMVLRFQTDIVCDTEGYYQTFRLENEDNIESKEAYEKELIDICKKNGYVLVTNNPSTKVWAWVLGVKAHLWSTCFKK